MTDAALVALIVGVFGVLTSAISGVALVQSQRTHKLINSRMDELLAAARKLARAEGQAEGEQRQRDRQAPEVHEA